MQIVVRRTGGVAGVTRSWHVDTDELDDQADWQALVGELPDPAAATDPGVPDDFSYTITIEQTTVTVRGAALTGPWSALVHRVRDEGAPGS